MKRRVLVVDIGGTWVKLLVSLREQREFGSGPRMRPEQFIRRFKESVQGWEFDVASIGFPAPVRKGHIVSKPKHLGKGWVDFNFARALGIPVRLINDAAMQALGSYRGGRMLFLGLGTRLGSALVWEKTLLPLEPGALEVLGYLNRQLEAGDRMVIALPRALIDQVQLGAARGLRAKEEVAFAAGAGTHRIAR